MCGELAQGEGTMSDLSHDSAASWWSRGPAIVLLLAILVGCGYGLFKWAVGPADLNLQDWLHAVFAWLGISDPLAISVGVGVVVGALIATALGIAMRLVLFLLAVVFRL
ncbi:hypothetical protein ASC68_27185 [Devosia sp. Root105]|nr:hypothetical protein ASC68_27185 [Devosia sp. Root105]